MHTFGDIFRAQALWPGAGPGGGGGGACSYANIAIGVGGATWRVSHGGGWLWLGHFGEDLEDLLLVVCGEPAPEAVVGAP